MENTLLRNFYYYYCQIYVMEPFKSPWSDCSLQEYYNLRNKNVSPQKNSVKILRFRTLLRI